MFYSVLFNCFLGHVLLCAGTLVWHVCLVLALLRDLILELQFCFSSVFLTFGSFTFVRL